MALKVFYNVGDSMIFFWRCIYLQCALNVLFAEEKQFQGGTFSRKY